MYIHKYDAIKRITLGSWATKNVYTLYTYKVTDLVNVPVKQNNERSYKVAEPNKPIPG